MTTTINPKEITQFQKDSRHWWDENGPFAPLHALNPVRMSFIRDTICKHITTTNKQGPTKPLSGLKILDVGCGGGLVCEPLARMGGEVTGIDADEQAISVATAHANQSGLDIKYYATSIEDFRKQNKKSQFEVITALEIIEHVDHPELFISELVKLLKPDGILIISTLNRTMKSWALGIIAAEYILGWVPVGTHDWKQFIKPSQLAHMLKACKMRPIAASGLSFNPKTRDFYLAPHNLDVNYLMAFCPQKT